MPINHTAEDAARDFATLLDILRAEPDGMAKFEAVLGKPLVVSDFPPEAFTEHKNLKKSTSKWVASLGGDWSVSVSFEDFVTADRDVWFMLMFRGKYVAGTHLYFVNDTLDLNHFTSSDGNVKVDLALWFWNDVEKYITRRVRTTLKAYNDYLTNQAMYGSMISVYDIKVK